MKKKILFKFILIFPVALSISLLSFLLLYCAPGDAAVLILREKRKTALVTEKEIHDFAESTGLHKNFSTLYGIWIKNMLHGDLGTSFIDGEKVQVKLVNALGVTFIMSLIALTVYFLVGTLIGMSTAFSKSSLLRKTVTYWTVLSMAVPPFWVALFAVWFLGVKLKLIQMSGSRSLTSLFTPGILMGILYAGNVIALIKEKTEAVLKEPFILNAKAMGLSKFKIMYSHVFITILAPAISVSALAFSNFLGASILMEKIFSIAGFGTLLAKSISLKDYPVVSAGVLTIGMLICIANALADILYCIIDGRNRT